MPKLTQDQKTKIIAGFTAMTLVTIDNMPMMDRAAQIDMAYYMHVSQQPWAGELTTMAKGVAEFDDVYKEIGELYDLVAADPEKFQAEVFAASQPARKHGWGRVFKRTDVVVLTVAAVIGIVVSGAYVISRFVGEAA